MHDFDKHQYSLSQLRDLLTKEDVTELLVALSIEDENITGEQLALTIRTRAETERRRWQNVENMLYKKVEWTDG